MDIRPEEIKSIKSIGTLNGDEVKLIHLHGGFNVAIGKKNKEAKKAEALAAGSHPAIVSFQLEKEFKKDFAPAIHKSEISQLEKVECYNNVVSNDLVTKGIEVYTLSKDHVIDFVVTNQGIDLGVCRTRVEGDVLKIYDTNVTDSNYPVETLIGKAIIKKAEKMGLKIG